ncbi:MAG: hypothetical protein IKU52_07340 [Clostridia bacterium]|nr:hypothetical protein [Clostridia bacterium]
MSELLFARADDVIRRAENGMFAYGDFLNENESAQVKQYVGTASGGIVYRFWGGFEGSERCRFFAYPEYYDFDELKDCIKAVEIKGSGFVSLNHSSYLGALTALGIDRAKMGDIVLQENSAILFTDEKISEFLLTQPSPLTRVGKDCVKLYEFEPEKNFGIERKYKEIFDTLASPRLDAAVSALACVAREKAKNIILSGSVQLNYLLEQRPDIQILNGDIITIRGTGKFLIVSVSEKTKKERYRLSAKKYI